MTKRDFHYKWQWQMAAAPAQLWPLVADTNRFDRDTGLPAYVDEHFDQAQPASQRRRLQVNFFGVPLAWIEEPFEWVRPYRFGVTRYYEPGWLIPLKEMRIQLELEPYAGGSRLNYEVRAVPRGWLGWLIIPILVGIVYRLRFGAVFRRYDAIAAANQHFMDAPRQPSVLAPGAGQRLARARHSLLAANGTPALVERLLMLVTQGDDLDVERIRPYALADHWQVERRALLELCLLATRLGILDASWDLLCPACRGPRHSTDNLGDVGKTVRCEACNLDYQADFDQTVELTFKPNPSIRRVPERLEFCTAGPESTPHIVAQMLLPPHDVRPLSPLLADGRYRLRTLSLTGDQSVQVNEDGEREVVVVARPEGVTPPQSRVIATPQLTLTNETPVEQLFILEEMAWSDQAATAAEVTMLQQYRDLFAREALRPGDQVAVGSLTILFTDLVDSTQLYRQIGDAPAFGLVMNHFDVLRAAINAEEGVLVKTIGDAVMAAFRRPVSALRAVYAAQMALQSLAATHARPLRLKAAVHHGPAIAVTLNERLDYFGSTVNIAARLEKFATGSDIIISEQVYEDPEVAELLANPLAFPAEPFRENLKGFDDECFALWRLTLRAAQAQ